MRDINIYFLTFCNQAVQTIYPYSPVPDINSEMGIVQWLGPFMGWIGLGHIFTARRYSSAVYAMGLCLSVCLSVTSRCSTKTSKRGIKQTAPLDSPGL